MGWTPNSKLIAQKTDKLSEETKKVKVVTAGMKTQVTVQGIRLFDLEFKIEQLEREKRRTFLVIDGIEESEKEETDDTAEIVEYLFKDI